MTATIQLQNNMPQQAPEIQLQSDNIAPDCRLWTSHHSLTGHPQTLSSPSLANDSFPGKAVILTVQL